MKKNYLLGLIVLGLISLSVYSTYAMFTASVETNDIVSLSASTLPTNSEIVEYERLTIKSKEKKVIEYTVNNNTDNSLYYGVWYEMINPSSINDDIVIGKSEDTTSDTLGQLTTDSNAKVLFVIENKSSSNIVVNVGVGYSETSSLNLPTNRNLITEVYKEGVLATEYITSLVSSNPDTMNNDDPDGNVRYMGADPNNYVRFNNELWRIIGVFDVKSSENGELEKRVKIIRDEPIENMAWDSGNENDWTQASLQEYLNGDYYNSIDSVSQNLIGDTYWNLGGTADFQSSSNGLPSHFYGYERGTTVDTGRPTYWVGKIGLMYPSDYGYATSGGTTKNRASCLARQLVYWDSSSYSDCKNNDYLYNSSFNQWTLTPRSSLSYRVFHVYNSGFLDNDYASNADSASPVLYLKSTVEIIGGEGTSENPYTLG